MNLFLLLVSAIYIVSVSSSSIPGPGQEGKRLIQTSEVEPAQWLTEGEIFDLIQENRGFVDITNFEYTSVSKKKPIVTAIPKELRFNETVKDIIGFPKQDGFEQFVTKFSSYHNRYCTSESGREAQLWLFNEILAVLTAYKGGSSVTEVEHGYLQKSIVVRLEGNDTQLKEEVVIIGAHMDSVTLGANAPAPGADDNAAGSSVVFEALKTIISRQVILKRSLEFHFYAAEEIGLVGSQDIAKEYKSNKIPVTAMLNYDVVGYHVEGLNDIAIHEDNSDLSVIAFLQLLADTHLTYGRRPFRCGYGCSDHFSWTQNDFPAGIASEVITNPHMHTVQDTIQHVNFEQVVEYFKLGVAFLVELGEPLSFE